MISYLRKKERDTEICIEAVKSNASALYYVPEELKENVSSYCKTLRVDSPDWTKEPLLDEMSEYLNHHSMTPPVF